MAVAVISRIAPMVVVVAVAAARLQLPVASAAEPPQHPADIPVADPDWILERLFGQQGKDDREALDGPEVSVREERQMGQQAVRAYLGELKRRGLRVVTRGRDVEYLRDLVETIRPRMQHADRYPRIQLYLVQSSRCDARSFPGGTLVFFRGLLETADSEAAVVGIVGHELSHLDRGHHLRRARQIKLARQTFATGEEPSLERFLSVGTTLMRAFARPFRPEAEAEADRDGARWAYAAGYDPREMARLFLKLRQRQPGLPIPLPSFLRSHPAAEDRHRAIMEVYGELQQAEPKDRLYVGRENLRRRVARSRREFEQ